MKRFIVLGVMSLIIATTTIAAHQLPPPPFNLSDRWLVALDTLEVFAPVSIFTAYWYQFIATNPADQWSAGFQASYQSQQEAFRRANQAIKDLCDHDPIFCAETFTRYDVRWRRSP